MVVVADTTPLHYLVLIEHEHILPTLFGQVWVPPAVLEELRQPETPPTARAWAAAPPAWVHVHAPAKPLPSLSTALGAGERESLALAIETKATLVLVDDRLGRREAHRLGLATAGTVRILTTAAARGLVDASQAVARLRATTFRASEDLLQEILAAANRR